jgi:hypothetical protein
MIATLEQVLEILAEGLNDAETGRRVRQLLAEHGSLEDLIAHCEAIRLWSGGNYLPLLWKSIKSWRSALFEMTKVLNFIPAAEDRRLLKAMEVVMQNQYKRAEWIEDEIDLSFVSDR